jgi:hypothetical protein
MNNQLSRSEKRGRLFSRNGHAQWFNAFLTTLTGGILNPSGMNKKFLPVLMAVFFLGSPLVHAQQPKDVIVIVDTSTAMSPFYANVTNYLTGAFLRENLQLGDTFHLISFAGKPRFEIARRIIDEGDVQTINSRIFLLYPLEPASDIQAAISYGERYTGILPQNRQKKIFVVSSGNGEGQTGASAARLKEGVSLSYLKAPLPESTAAITQSRPVQDPGRPSTADGTSAGGTAAVRTPAETRPASSGTAAASPAARPPAETASRSPAQGTTESSRPAAGSSPGGTAGPVSTAKTSPGERPATPPGRQNTASGGEQGQVPGTGRGFEGSAEPRSSTEALPDAQSGIELSAPDSDGRMNSGPGIDVPETSRPVPASTADGAAVSAGTDNRAPDNESGSAGYSGPVPFPVIAGGGILALLLIGFLVVVLSRRRLNSSANKAIAAASKPADSSGVVNRSTDLLNSYNRKPAAQPSGSSRAPSYSYRDNPNQFLSNPPMLNLFVEDQNTAIGRRNVHILKAGSRLTVGGSPSDFLIFLVPLPPNIGELRFDGKTCTFIPLKPQYFPDIGSNQVHECVGKTIRVISDKKYELFFRFERFSDPLVELNQLLCSIKVPEK